MLEIDAAAVVLGVLGMLVVVVVVAGFVGVVVVGEVVLVVVLVVLGACELLALSALLLLLDAEFVEDEIRLLLVLRSFVLFNAPDSQSSSTEHELLGSELQPTAAAAAVVVVA